ncbi:aminoglycoside phosphotransferase family protein [Bacillus sp. AFS033286]|uniref:aminoglycoside phosphotransferase family protein n=1 Tax=Bacillus sp. AFS033286 TaxID=2033498 RepID=UPI00159BC33A|nr:aminoglycoside phosphotransferase family protein [Bacillus sp. AFS033286]
MKSEDIYATVKQLIQRHKEIKTGIKIKNLEINKDGFNNDIAIFNLTYSQDGETLSNEVVLKNFSGNNKNDFENKKYTKEVQILKSNTINKFINLPNVYFEDEEKKIILMKKLEGVTLDKFYLAHPESTLFALRKFGETLAHIHSVDTNAIRNYFNDDDLWQENYINLYINSLKNRVMEFTDPEYLQILDTISERFKAVEFNEVLNHGDYHFWNVIIADDAKLYILDWEKARLGDYRYDIANTLILGYSWFGINFKQNMLDGYQNITKKEIEHLDCFEALLSFDSFTKMVPLIQGADDSHIRDRSFEWLKRRYELFVRHNGKRIKKAEDYLTSKGLSL